MMRLLEGHSAGVGFVRRTKLTGKAGSTDLGSHIGMALLDASSFKLRKGGHTKLKIVHVEIHDQYIWNLHDRGKVRRLAHSRGGEVNAPVWAQNLK